MSHSVKTKTTRGFGIGHKKEKVTGNEKWKDLVAYEADVLPSHVNLIDKCPSVWDQQVYGSCTSHATCAVYAFHCEHKDPSRAFLYDISREYEKVPLSEDSGCMISDVVEALKEKGVCDSQHWPYDHFHLITTPNAQARNEAKNRIKGIQYTRLPQDLHTLKHALAQGRPFILGVQVYESFENDKSIQTGHIPIPNIKKERCEGGHAVCIVGYDDATHTFIMRNSWGTSVGLPEHPGYFTLPYEYVTNPDLASDFFDLEVVEK